MSQLCWRSHSDQLWALTCHLCCFEFWAACLLLNCLLLSLPKLNSARVWRTCHCLLHTGYSGIGSTSKQGPQQRVINEDVITCLPLTCYVRFCSRCCVRWPRSLADIVCALQEVCSPERLRSARTPIVLQPLHTLVHGVSRLRYPLRPHQGKATQLQLSLRIGTTTPLLVKLSVTVVNEGHGSLEGPVKRPHETPSSKRPALRSRR